jgi:hypothetical protein
MRLLNNQRDETYKIFFIIVISALNFSGGFFAHHQELVKLYVQPWVLLYFPAGKHDNTQGCTYSFTSS